MSEEVACLGTKVKDIEEENRYAQGNSARGDNAAKRMRVNNYQTKNINTMTAKNYSAKGAPRN